MRHQIFGLFIDEWVGMVTILSAVIGAMGWILNRTLDRTMIPLRMAIQNLTKTIEGLERDSRMRMAEVKALGDSLESHLIDSQEIKTKVQNLEKEVYDRKR